MRQWKRRESTEKTGFYWQGGSKNNKTLEGYVEIQPIKLTKINEFYHKDQLQQTHEIVGILFMQRHIRYYQYRVFSKLFSDKDAPDLQLWNFLISYPPTHSICVGRIQNGQKHESVKLTVSLRIFEMFEKTIVLRTGKLMAYLIQSQSDLQYLLTPNINNVELWLLCVFVNVKRVVRTL